VFLGSVKLFELDMITFTFRKNWNTIGNILEAMSKGNFGDEGTT